MSIRLPALCFLPQISISAWPFGQSPSNPRPIHVKKSPIYLLIVLLSLVEGCQIYHDTTARYNAYFLAKEKMLVVEDALFGNPADDYNDVLQVLVKLDTNVGKSKKAELDYCIEMAAKPIQWHKTSKWTDDAWLLVGKARLYQGDFTNATRSFKYVNSNSEDPDARHAAMVLLMRAFIDMEEYNNSDYVNEFIRKDTIPFSDENARDYHIARAHFYRLQGRMDMVAKHLEVAMPVIKKNKLKARTNFILAQIAQRAGDNEKAYAAYQQVLKSNPSFELEFYSMINAYGLQSFEAEEEVTAARAYYAKMLKDDKYWDYRDKVQYEWARFEQRQGNIDEAIAHYNESIAIGKKAAQRAYAYLRMAEINYESENFERASAYYDSAATDMPQEFDVFRSVEERNEIMQDFAFTQGVFKEQDRLLTLSKMDTASLMAYLTEEFEKDREQALQRKKFEEGREQLRQQQTPPPKSTPFQKPGETSWYFYNVDAVSSGKVSFIRTWGNRPLEDDWRRINKPFNLPETNTIDPENTSVAPADSLPAEKDVFAGIKSPEKRLLDIPRDAQDVEKMHIALQESLFKLGKIYHFGLKNEKNAVTVLTRLADDYPKYDSVPDALYLMYSICQDYEGCNPNSHKQRLINDYPEHLYAKILKNPNFLQEAYKDDIEAEKLYTEAYTAYQQGDFSKAQSQLSTIRAKYDKTQHLDKVTLLEVMVVGKQGKGNRYPYEQGLKAFIAKYEQSPLLDYAKRLLEASKSLSPEGSK